MKNIIVLFSFTLCLFAAQAQDTLVEERQNKDTLTIMRYLNKTTTFHNMSTTQRFQPSNTEGLESLNTIPSFANQPFIGRRFVASEIERMPLRSR